MKKYAFFFVFLFLLAAVSHAEDTYKPYIYDIHCWQSSDQIVILFKYHQLIGGMDNCEVIIGASVERGEKTTEFFIKPLAVKTSGYSMEGLNSKGARTVVIPIIQEAFQINDKVIFEIYLDNKPQGQSNRLMTETLKIENWE